MDKPTNALSWGRKPAAFTKLIELAQRVFEDRPATSQESGLTKEFTWCNQALSQLTAGATKRLVKCLVGSPWTLVDDHSPAIMAVVLRPFR